MSDLFEFFEREQQDSTPSEDKAFCEDSPAPTEGGEKIYQVSELTSEIRQTLEEHFGSVWLCGEVSNLSRPRSGHLYFSLKDEGAQISAVVWRSVASRLSFELEDGQEVLVYGRITVYAGRGNYQILPERIELKGVGALELAFRKLREKLEREGLFDPQRKRPIPFLPRCIGIVTSPTGAAIRDMLTTIYRRFPQAHVILAPARVQGEGAAEEIAQRIDDLNEYGQVDVIIVGRGGGSLEDLWAFNEEVVARAIFRSKIPVISAVGHEVDVSISDLVADLRCPTPTAAGERVVPDYRELCGLLEDARRRLEVALERYLEHLRDNLERLRRHHTLQYPEELILQWAEKLDSLSRRLEHPVEAKLGQWRERLENLAQRLFRAPLVVLEQWKGRLALLATRMESASPVKTLQRGYSLALSPTKEVLDSVDKFQEGQQFQLHLQDGVVQAEVKWKKEGEPLHGQRKEEDL